MNQGYSRKFELHNYNQVLPPDSSSFLRIGPLLQSPLPPLEATTPLTSPVASPASSPTQDEILGEPVVSDKLHMMTTTRCLTSRRAAHMCSIINNGGKAVARAWITRGFPTLLSYPRWESWDPWRPPSSFTLECPPGFRPWVHPQACVLLSTSSGIPTIHCPLSNKTALTLLYRWMYCHYVMGTTLRVRDNVSLFRCLILGGF